MATRRFPQLLCSSLILKACRRVKPLSIIVQTDTPCTQTDTPCTRGMSWRHKATLVQTAVATDTAITGDHGDGASGTKFVSKEEETSNAAQPSATEILASLDEEGQKKLQVIKLEHDVLLHMGVDVPEDLTDDLWLTVFKCETASARRKIYRYLRKTELRKGAKKRKQEERRTILDERQRLKESNPNPESKNTIFLHIRDKTMNNFYYSRLAHAMQFGPELLIDIGYEDFMKEREIINVADQILMSFGNNKLAKEPFHFVFCNGVTDGKLLKTMQNCSRSRPLDDFMFTITEKSYLDLYPKEKLVYLTPNAPNFLEEYNHDDVYIIGGFVDKNMLGKPVSFARAKEQGIRCAKLPLDLYLTWCKGNKILTIDQMISIMLNIKDTADWTQAFQHVPRRKLAQNPY